jgi:hypothetical protein
MPANELIPYYEDGHRLTGQASAAITGKRFVGVSGNRTSGPGIPTTAQVGASDPVEGGNYQFAHATAAAKAVGVSTWDAAIGEKVGVIRHGVVPVTAGANIAAGVEVEVGANGQAVTLAAGKAVGYCMTGVLSGADAEILLYG